MAFTTLKIKQSLGSFLPKKRNAHTLSAESLSRLVNDTSKMCYLKHRCYGTLSMRPTWKRRFVILANTALYVFDNENSNSPKTCISLVGYNRVHRVDTDRSSQWPFAIVSEKDPNVDILFDCSSDHERREWMGKIKDSLHKANNVQPRKISLVEQLATSMNGSGPSEGAGYTLLEQPVYRVEIRDNEVNRKPGLKYSVFYDDNDDDDSDICDYNADLNDDDDGIQSDNDDYQHYDVGIWCRLQRKGAIKKRRGRAVSSDSAVMKEA